jgi:hypothetical protein
LKCPNNPENKSKCDSCWHLIKKELLEYYDTFNGEGSRPVNVFFCEKINSALFPLTMDPEKRIDFGDTENQPMKKECEYHNSTFLNESFDFNLI